MKRGARQPGRSHSPSSPSRAFDPLSWCVSVSTGRGGRAAGKGLGARHQAGLGPCRQRGLHQLCCRSCRSPGAPPLDLSVSPSSPRLLLSVPALQIHPEPRSLPRGAAGGAPDACLLLISAYVSCVLILDPSPWLLPVHPSAFPVFHPPSLPRVHGQIAAEIDSWFLLLMPWCFWTYIVAQFGWQETKVPDRWFSMRH